MKPIKEITLIRIMLMLMIFTHHITVQYNGGASAVSAFFVLSGFVMMYGYGRRILLSDFVYGHYFCKRLIRFYPMHWLILGGYLIYHLYSPSTTMEGERVFVANATLLQSWIPKMDYYFSYNSPSWYLSDLLLFVALFTLLAKNMLSAGRKQRSLSMFVLVCLYFLLWIITPPSMRHEVIYINPVSRLIDCIIGMYTAVWCAEFVKKERERKNPALINCLILVCMLVFVSTTFLTPRKWILLSAIYWLPFVPMLALLTLTSGTENVVARLARMRLVQWVGRCSFSFYMVHVLVIDVVRTLTSKMALSVPASWGISFLITLSVAQLLYILIEQKLTGWLNHKLIKTN